MSVTFKVLKAEDNLLNDFVADEDKAGDMIVAYLTVNRQGFSGQGDTQEAACEDLRERINSHFDAQKHIAKVEIDKAIGQHFFD